MSETVSSQQVDFHWVSACFAASDMASLASLVVDQVLHRTGVTAFFVGLVQPNEVVVRARVGGERPPAFVVQFLESQKYLGSHESVKNYMAQVGVPWSGESRCLRIGSKVVLVEPLVDQHGEAFAQVIVTDFPIHFGEGTTVLETVQGVLAEMLAVASVAAWSQLSDASPSDDAAKVGGRRTTKTQLLVVESLLHRLNGSLASLSLMSELADFTQQKTLDDIRSVVRGLSRDLMLLDEAAVSWTYADSGGLLSSITALLPFVTTDLRRRGVALKITESRADTETRLWISSVVTVRMLQAILEVLYIVVSSSGPHSRQPVELQVEVTQATRLEVDIAIMHSMTRLQSTDQISAAVQRAMGALELTATALGGSLAWNLEKGRTVLSFRR